MTTLNINGKRVKVGDEFWSLSREDQNATVDEIAQSLGAGAPAQEYRADQQGRATRAQRESLSAPIGMMDAVSTGVGQGLTFNMLDEMRGLDAASPLRTQSMERGQQAIREAGLPVIPNPIDMAAGGIRMLAEKVAPSIFGQGGNRAYDERVAQERAALDQTREQRPYSMLAGQVLGGVAQPIPGAAMSSVPRAIGTGAAMGALSGFGAGNGFNDSLQDAATGGAVGGALGGVIGRFMQPRASGGPVPAVAGGDAAKAANELGVPLPRAVASDSTAVQRAGQTLRNVPLVGDRIPQAMRETSQALGQKADEIVASLGSGERTIAGQRASESIREWMTGESSALVSKAYDALDSALQPNVAVPLSNTQGAIAKIMARRAQAGPSASQSGAINEIIDSVRQPGGLTFDGIKQLRTMMAPSQGKNLIKDIDQGEAKLLYGALTDDMREAARAAGGARGVQLFERANAVNRAVAKRREALEKVIGRDGDATGENVFERLATFASEGKGGDLGRLALAKKVMEPEEWNDVASAVIGRMGRNAAGELTPDRLVTAWGKLSDGGKNILFGQNTPHREALDKIFTVSLRMQDAVQKFGNPSGTGQAVMGGTIGAAGLNAAGQALAGNVVPAVNLLATVVGGRALANLLAAPASASSMAKWAQAYEIAVRKPTAATAIALDRATKNMASTIGEKAGVPNLADAVMRQIMGGPARVPAEPASSQEQM